MFRGLKSIKLSRAYAQVQHYATQKKVWGNNIVTLVTVNNIISDFYNDLFDSDKFITLKKNTAIQSSFANISDMTLWLSEVRLVFKEAAMGTKIEFSGTNAHLNITKQHDVALTDFLTKDGYPISLNDTFKSMSRIINEISSYLGSISNNQRQYFDLRLGNGLNTLLVFHELLLEVMINE